VLFAFIREEFMGGISSPLRDVGSARVVPNPGLAKSVCLLFSKRGR